MAFSSFCFLTAGMSEGNQISYVVAGLLQSNCSKRRGGSCKAAYDVFMQVPEYHLHHIRLGKQVTQARQVQGKGS